MSKGSSTSSQDNAKDDKIAKEGGYVDAHSVVSEQTLLAQREGIKPAFLAKVQVLNNALNEIGMGRYQYELFLSGGFGWFADNIWLQAVAIVMPAVQNELQHGSHVKLATLALYCGLIVGAAFWGMTADIVGRRFSWNATLCIGGVFGLLVASAPNFNVFCFWISLVGFGVGGNLPVDGTLFLEFLPANKQYLLTLLSVWWAIGQVVASLIAWGFIARWGCVPPADDPDYYCPKSTNMGWRYTYITLGAMMVFFWAVRFFILPVFESPKFLCSKGKDSEAVAVIQKLAKRNGVECHLTVEDLRAAAKPYLPKGENQEELDTKFSTWELTKNSLEEFKGAHIKAIFVNRRLAFSSTLIILIYGILGLAYPLYMSFLGVYLKDRAAAYGDTSLNATYSAYTYQAACGVPGSILAAIMVEINRLGRKLSLAFFIAATGAFLFGMTASKNMVQVNALSSMAAFFANAFYGVLFGYAPELFPTPSRGTGDALCATAMRIFGFFAPIISIWGAPSSNGPVFASAALFMFAAFLTIFLPVETRGKQSL